MLQAESIRVVYRKRGRSLVALDGVGLETRAGEILAVLGPSGSGKSTLLHVLGLLLTPQQGRLRIDGQDATALSAAKRKRMRRRYIGFLFQRFHLVPYLTALENVQVALALKGADASGAGQLLARVGIASRADHLPDDLSAGECQRVALARAFAGDPALLLADEPTGSLDPGNGQAVVEHLVAAARAGAAVVLVTHDPALAARADRCLHLRAGVEDSPAQEPR